MDSQATQISVFEPTQKNAGAQVTYSTNSSRKSFHLPKPADPKSIRPMAIESFAMDPQVYHQWMSELDRYLRKQKFLK